MFWRLYNDLPLGRRHICATKHAIEGKGINYQTISLHYKDYFKGHNIVLIFVLRSITIACGHSIRNPVGLKTKRTTNLTSIGVSAIHRATSLPNFEPLNKPWVKITERTHFLIIFFEYTNIDSSVYSSELCICLTSNKYWKLDAPMVYLDGRYLGKNISSKKPKLIFSLKYVIF
jgi:hypothetical protein